MPVAMRDGSPRLEREFPGKCDLKFSVLGSPRCKRPNWLQERSKLVALITIEVHARDVQERRGFRREAYRKWR